MHESVFALANGASGRLNALRVTVFHVGIACHITMTALVGPIEAIVHAVANLVVGQTNTFSSTTKFIAEATQLEQIKIRHGQCYFTVRT